MVNPFNDLLKQHARYQDSLKSELSLEMAEGQINALNFFTNRGLPSKKFEDWKYSDIPKKLQLAQKFFSIVAPDTIKTKTIEFIREQIKDLDNVIILIDGFYQQSLSRTCKDINIVSFAQVMAKQTSPFFKNKNDLYSYQQEQNPFIGLNHAFIGQGLYLEIPPNSSLKTPLYLINYCDQTDHTYMINPHTFVHVGENSTLKLVEQNHSQNGHEVLSNNVTDFYLSKNACVKHVKSQLEGNQTIHLSAIRAKIESFGNYQLVSLSSGALSSLNQVTIDLLGKEARTSINGLYSLNHDQQSSHNTVINHLSSHTYSSQLYKGILDDSSHGIFNGKIKVARNSQQVSSTQQNKNLILSAKAKVNTLPQLEIDADDVKCSHGATIGQLSPDQIFYLSSRGISPQKAKKMLANGFAKDVLTKIEDIELFNYLVSTYEHFNKNTVNERPNVV